VVAQDLMVAPAITFADGEEASGMAHMLGGLLEDNLRDYPSRARVAGLARGNVVLTASDRDVSVTLSFRGHEVVVANGSTERAPVLAGPWLEMAKLCSGQASPLGALARREVSITPRARLDTVAAAGYVLSVPPSFYGDEAAVRQRRRQAIGVGVVAVAAAVIIVCGLRRRRNLWVPETCPRARGGVGRVSRGVAGARSGVSRQGSVLVGLAVGSVSVNRPGILGGSSP
jgi:hypothetical protein